MTGGSEAYTAQSASRWSGWRPLRRPRRASGVTVVALRGLRRSVVVMVIVTFLAFSLVDLLPGDAATVVAGETATPQQVALVRSELGLDQPFLVRYGDWVWNALHGDLGKSFITRQPVTEALMQRVPVTIELTVLAMLLALVLAVPVALYSAYRPGRLVDRVSMGLGFGAASGPHFIVGLVLILLFAGGYLSLFPATGYVSFWDQPGANLRAMTLPAVTLALGTAAVYRQVLRSDTVATLQEDYVLLAKSKGLPDRQVMARHVLRPSSLSLLTLVGVSVGELISGSVVVETVFALPGLGQMILNAVVSRDYLMLQGALVFVSIAYASLNLIIELLYAVLDPRLRKAS